MTPLRQTMIQAMCQHGFSPRTQHSYPYVVTALTRYYRRSPDQLKVDDLQAYFNYLVQERSLSPASCRVYLHGIRFLYLQVLHWAHFDVRLVLPKRPQRIPELLTRQEVARLLTTVTNPKHQALLSVTYGCGLRVSEAVALTLKERAVISAQEIEQRRTADQLKLFVEEVRDRVESDKSEQRIARRGNGLYRMFIDEIIPLSQFAHLIYPPDTFFQPVIGNQGFDVEVSDGTGKLIDRVEIAKPHDGYAKARDSRLVEERGFGQIRVLDLGGQLEGLVPWIVRVAPSTEVLHEP